jgi:copper(I)-binding protein
MTFTASAADVSITDATVRGMPPGQKITAAFMSVTNNGNKSCNMMAVETDVTERAELHTHLHESGMMRMRQVEMVEIPVGETVEFKPGSLHVMMFGLKRDLLEGEKVTLSVDFSNCDDIVVDAKVRSAKKSHKNHH